LCLGRAAFTEPWISHDAISGLTKIRA